ncbi:MAG: hypothetical protein LC107_02770 [Chitinophagales bacterium]|nr:hypothetical protein [Chitinophagales bacterium]
MLDFLVFLAIGIFVALFFLNFYFRVKIMKVYKKLISNRIEFGTSHIFNMDKMKKEILPKYPAYTEDIMAFSNHIRKSLLIASILLVAITLVGIILKNI